MKTPGTGAPFEDSSRTARRRQRALTWGAYVAAVVLPLALMAFRLAMGFAPGDAPLLILFVAPTMVSAYLGGLRPGLLATLVSALLTEYFLLRVPGQPPLVEAVGNPAWGLLLLVCVILSALAETLHRSRERFRAILESSLDAIVVSDHAGRILEFNGAAERIFGYRRGQVMGREMSEVIIPPDLREMHRRGMARFLATGHGRMLGQRLELSAMRSDGSVFPVELSIVRVGEKNPPIFTGYIRDLTERERAREASRRTERLYQSVFNQQFQFMAILDPDGRVREINDLPLKVGRLRREDYVGRFFWETPNWVNLSEWHHIWPKRLQEAARTDGPVLTADVFQTADGEIRHADAATTAVRNASGGVEFFIIQATDTTERRKAEQAVRELNASLEQRVAQRTRELEASNQELESFSYSVSHDLRSPLRSIAGFSQALLTDAGAKLAAGERRYLERIIAATERMSQLIDDLLELARMSRAEVDRRPVDLSALARTIVESLRQGAPTRSVEVLIADGLVAEADPRLTRIALENLLGNAWKFTMNQAHARIEMGSERDEKGQTVFFVRDNGAGFDMAYAGKLFGVFERLHGTNEYPGTGVGLATVQRIIRRHGGRIWANAAVDAGATFRFTLQ